MKKATLYMLAMLLAPAMVFAQDVNWPHTVGPEYEDYTYYMFDLENQEVTDTYFTWDNIEEGGFLTEDGIGPWPRGKAFSQDGTTVYVGQFSWGAFPSVAQRFDYDDDTGEWEFTSNWPRGYEGDEEHYVENDEGEDVPHPVHHTTHGMAVDGGDNLWIQHYFQITDLVHGEEGEEDTTAVSAIYVFDDEGIEKDFSPIKAIEFGEDDADTLTNFGVGLREITGGPYEGDIVAAYGRTLYIIDHETGEGIHKTEVYDDNTLTSPGVDEEGNIYASNVFGGHPVYQYTPDLDSRTEYIDADNASGFSRSVQVSEDGLEFYRAAYTSHAVMRYEREVITQNFEEPEPVMRGFSAQSLDRDRDGNLWANAGDDGQPANRWLFEAPRAQLIHASADPAAAEVDIYVTDDEGNDPNPAEDDPALGGVSFQDATDYLVFPEGETVQVEFTAPGEDDVVFSEEVTFDDIGESIIVARGDFDADDTGFGLDIIDGRLQSVEADEVDLEIYHAVTDAPAVDAYARGVDQLAESLAFGENTGFQGLLPDMYAVDIYGEGSDPDEDEALFSYQFDLEAEATNALTAVATGYLDPNDDNGAAEFDIIVVTADGQVLHPRNITSSPAEDDPEIAQEVSLEQNYPNPFNPATNIEFSIPETRDVTLTVYDMLGREVTTLVNDQMSAGTHTVTFDASNLSSGTYIYRLEAGGEQITRQMSFVK